MGTSGENKKKNQNDTKTKEDINLSKPNKANEAKGISEINKNSNRVKECMLETSPLIKIDRIISNVSKSICKIKIETSLGTIYGTGFLLRFYIDQESFYCLVSNEHVISNDIINNENNIYISYDSEFKSANIKLDKNKRYIKSFTDLDVTVVEIIEEDNIYRDYFLYAEPEERIKNRLINMNIYIPQYAEGKELKNAKGIIKEINNYEFTHLASTLRGSSGSPIFLENSINVIGIHKEGNTVKLENYGDFIYPAINIIKEDIRKKRDKGKYIDGKYIWEDNKYYIGEFKNNIPNGKGIKYYPNGNILYDGYFVNGKFEGKGKYIAEDGKYFIGEYKNGLRQGKGIGYYRNGNTMVEGEFINGKLEGNGKYIAEDGKYYIGQWKNYLINGKGILYYSNGKIMYDGEFVNDKFEGNGKGILENGEYYIGQWKNGLSHGKGILYYSNGKIMYDGEFVNKKFEGNGKYIWEDGKYYIGQWKNGLRNGKGILYYSNGNIKYDGEFVNDKAEGNGKYIYENGNYYIGQFKNDLSHGKGILYYSNGNIKYDGEFVNDKFEGNGKYIWEDGEYYIGQWKNGLRNGKGIEYYSNGKIMYDGEFVNDKFVKK